MICEPEVIHKDPCTSPAPRLYLPCTSHISPLYLAYISPVPRLYLPCTSQVIHKDPSSLALTLHYTLRVDTGLSLASARQLLDESLLAKERKSNRH